MELYATWKVGGDREWEKGLIGNLGALGIKRDWSEASVIERIITGFGLIGERYARYTLPLMGKGVAVNLQPSETYLDKRTGLRLGYMPAGVRFKDEEWPRVVEIGLSAERPEIAVPSYQEIAKYSTDKVLDHQIANRLSALLNR